VGNFNVNNLWLIHNNDILIWDTAPGDVNYKLDHAAVVTSVYGNSVSIEYIYATQPDNSVHYNTLSSSNNYEDSLYGRPNYVVRWSGQKTYGYAITVKTSFNGGTVKVGETNYSINGSSGTVVKNLSRGQHTLLVTNRQFYGTNWWGYKNWTVVNTQQPLASYPDTTAIVSTTSNSTGFGVFSANYGTLHNVTFQNNFGSDGSGGVIKVNDVQYNSPASGFSVADGNSISGTAIDQTAGYTQYLFTNWSDGSTQRTHNFNVTSDTTCTANFVEHVGAYISGPTTPPCSYTDWTAHVSGGFPPYHYQWYDMQGSFSPQLKNKITPDAPIGQWIPVGTDSLILNFFICTGNHTLRVDVTDAKGYTATSQLSVGGGPASPTQSTLNKNESLESIKNIVPETYNLGQNYPNPFNPTTQIKYALKEDGFVTIKVYDLLGKVVATLVNENKSAGYYTINFDASRLSSGIYFYTIRSNDYYDRKKMIVLK